MQTITANVNYPLTGVTVQVADGTDPSDIQAAILAAANAQLLVNYETIAVISETSIQQLAE